jgi:hypothetical protein
VSRQRISLNCLTIRSSMIPALCQAIIHQRQPTRSYTQTFRRFLGVVYIVLGPLSNVIHIYTIFQYSPTSRGHRLPTGVDQFPHPKSSADYISASSTSSYAHSQDFAMYPLSILHPFGFSILPFQILTCSGRKLQSNGHGQWKQGYQIGASSATPFDDSLSSCRTIPAL